MARKYIIRTLLYPFAFCGILLGAHWILPLKSSAIPVSFASVAAGGVLDSNVFVNLSKKMVPSVVNISTVNTVKGPLFQGNSDDVLRKFFGDLFRQYNQGGGRGAERGGSDEEDGVPPSSGTPFHWPKTMSLGTGFIIDSAGLILTNNHVVADADEIKISFTEAADEKPSDAEVVGRDPDLDIALIKVKNKREMVPALLGDSDAVEVGEYVMAVGNPFGQGHSVTHGIISGKGRPAPDFPLANYLQTDAPINPGNSGGPLINLKGEVIGINNAIDQRAQGIGFAIPINLVKKILPQLRTQGIVTRGYIGVLVDNLTPELSGKMGLSKEMMGPVVTHVYPGQPAEKAGIQTYDVILEFGGKPVHSGSDLIAAVTAVAVGESVPVKVSRGGQVKNLTIQVGQRPGAQQLASQEKKQGKSKGKPKQRITLDVGMTLEDITPETARDLGLPQKVTGVVVVAIAFGGPADKAGIQRGDVILEVDRKPLKSVDSFYATVKEKKSYLMRVRRSDPQGREAFSVVILDLAE